MDGKLHVCFCWVVALRKEMFKVTNCGRTFVCWCFLGGRFARANVQGDDLWSDKRMCAVWGGPFAQGNVQSDELWTDNCMCVFGVVALREQMFKVMNCGRTFECVLFGVVALREQMLKVMNCGADI